MNQRVSSLSDYSKVVVSARNVNDGELPIQIALLLKDGSAYGGLINVSKKGDYSISLAELKPVSMVTLPRPYPSFLPYYFNGSEVSDFDIQNVETLQISIGPGLTNQEQQASYEIGIESVRLE